MTLQLQIHPLFPFFETWEKHSVHSAPSSAHVMLGLVIRILPVFSKERAFFPGSLPGLAALLSFGSTETTMLWVFSQRARYSSDQLQHVPSYVSSLAVSSPGAGVSSSSHRVLWWARLNLGLGERTPSSPEFLPCSWCLPEKQMLHFLHLLNLH